MSFAIVMRRPGPAEVLQLESVTLPVLRPDAVRLRHTAIGVNFHDVYVRSGLYQTLPLPGIPGIEAVGVVQEVGTHVTQWQPGDRVGYITRQYGAYAQERHIAADQLLRLPDAVDDVTAASMLLKGLTAQVLLHKVHAVQAGDWVLVHAAAGAVGSLLCQWAQQLGARVIGTVGSDAKRPRASAAGCSHVLNYREQDFVAAVHQITNGAGVQVAYDAVGKDTFTGSLQCLAPCGQLVNFGQSSGPVAPVALSDLFVKSNVLSRPSVFQHLRTPAMLLAAASSLFETLQTGGLQMPPSLEFALQDTARAHLALEDRQRTQPIVLIP